MSQIHEGGCLCGAVRYRAKNEPERKSICHCRNCQRRTGSAFGIGAYFREADVELHGELRTYELRSDESGRWLKMQFCPNCGGTVTWTVEAFPACVPSPAARSTTRTGSGSSGTSGRAPSRSGSCARPAWRLSRRARSRRRRKARDSRPGACAPRAGG